MSVITPHLLHQLESWLIRHPAGCVRSEALYATCDCVCVSVTQNLKKEKQDSIYENSDVEENTVVGSLALTEWNLI